MKSNRLTKINSPYVPPLVGPACHTHVSVRKVVLTLTSNKR
jgi:hypothetical protein